MKKILADAAAFGQATGRALNWRHAMKHPDWAYYPGSQWSSMLWEGGAFFQTPPTIFEAGQFKPLPPTGARTLDSRTAFYYGYTLASPGMIMRAGSQGFPSPAAQAAADGSTTLWFGPSQPKDVPRGNWIQTVPGKGWFTILRLYSPLPSFFDKSWRVGEIQPVK